MAVVEVVEGVEVGRDIQVDQGWAVDTRRRIRSIPPGFMVVRLSSMGMAEGMSQEVR